MGSRLLTPLAALAVASLSLHACSRSDDALVDEGSTSELVGGDEAAKGTVEAAGPALFAIGVHIEPWGTEVSPLAGGGSSKSEPAAGVRPERSGRGKSKSKAGISPELEAEILARKGGKSKSKSRSKSKSGRGGGGGKSYLQGTAFDEHVANLRNLMEVVGRHEGKLVIQSQDPFTQLLIDRGDTLFADAEAAGHEVALHFHEDAHLGSDFEEEPVEVWTGVMKEQIAQLEKAGATEVNYWSGGNTYGQLMEAATAAGLSVNGDFKSRYTEGNTAITDVHPWRPASGADRDNVTDFIRHDPQGSVVFLPEGLLHASEMKRSLRGQGDAALLDAYSAAFEQSLAACDHGGVRTLHLTVHPNELTRGSEPYEELDRWLETFIDPLVASGDLQWATYSEMADAYRSWGGDAKTDGREGCSLERTVEAEAPSVALDANNKPNITFVINTHDWKRHEDSAEILTRLIDLFEQHGVRGDFYVTAPMVQLWAEKYPALLEKFRDSDQGISYHRRPPHPLVNAFSGAFEGLQGAELEAAVLRYETQRLDMETGELIPGEPGGYAFVRDTLGRAPAAVAGTQDDQLFAAATKVYRDLGAKVVVSGDHEGATDPLDPYRVEGGLLVRPSTLGVTHGTVGTKKLFWWNRVQRDPESHPLVWLKDGLDAWDGQGTFYATAIIHENNFYTSKATPWQLTYYQSKDSRKAKSPPYDLTIPDASTTRDPSEAEAIWTAYSELVAYAAEHMNVVTAADVAEAAGR